MVMEEIPDPEPPGVLTALNGLFAAVRGKFRLKNWRRNPVKMSVGVFLATAAVADIIYECRRCFLDSDLVERKPQAHNATRFMEQLQIAKNEVAPSHSLKDTKAEFKSRYSDRARSLLCSGCKLTAELIGAELQDRNATGQPDPTALLHVTKDAIIAACESLPPALLVVEDEEGKTNSASFEEVEKELLTGVELRRSDLAKTGVHRLCRVLLADATADMLELMIRHKVPQSRARGAVLSDNWERWLCVRQSRLCRNSEVTDDDEDEEREL